MSSSGKSSGKSLTNQ